MSLGVISSCQGPGRDLIAIGGYLPRSVGLEREQKVFLVPVGSRWFTTSCLFRPDETDILSLLRQVITSLIATFTLKSGIGDELTYLFPQAWGFCTVQVGRLARVPGAQEFSSIS